MNSIINHIHFYTYRQAICPQVNVTPRSDNPIAEYLSFNVLLDCESGELAFTALHKNLQNADGENTQNILSD